MSKRVLKIIIFVTIILCTIICEAAYIPVTMENLKDTLDKFANEDSEKEEYKFEIKEHILKISVDGDTYEIECDLTNKPTFKVTEEIKKGMSYEEFSKKQDSLMSQMICYGAVAAIQGASYADSTAYFMLSYLENSMKNDSGQSKKYIIVDDINNVVEKTESENTIYASEFGDRVMELVNNTYPEKTIISDAQDFNSFTYTIERINKTEDSCDLVTTLTVNPETDFSKISTNDFEESFMDKNITVENADYVIKLKVGQKYKFDVEFSGHTLYGEQCIEINYDTNEAVAVTPGKANGYISLGNNTNKTMYVIVEKAEETQNNSQENNTTNNTSNNMNNDASTNNNNNKENAVTNTQNISKIPNAGYHDKNVVYVLYAIIGISTIGIILKLSKKSIK